MFFWLIALCVAFVVGALTVLIIQYAVLVGFSTPSRTFPFHYQYEASRVPDALLDVLQPGESDGERMIPAETTAGLSLLIQFLYQELKDTRGFRRWMIRKLQLEFNDLLSRTAVGRIVQDIKLKDISVGANIPVIKHVGVNKAVMTNGDTTIEEIVATAAVEYSGGLQLSVVAELPRGMTALLTMQLASLTGTVRLHFDRRPYTHWSVCFAEEPHIDFRVESAFSGRPVPQLVPLIIGQFKRLLRRRHVLPAFTVRLRPFFANPSLAAAPLVTDYAHINLQGALTLHLVRCSRLNLDAMHSLIGIGHRLYIVVSLSSRPSGQEETFVSDYVSVILKMRRTNMGESVGITVQPDLPRSHAVISQLVPTSLAERSGFKNGDRLVAINGLPIVSHRHAERLLDRTGGEIICIVERHVDELEEGMDIVGDRKAVRPPDDSQFYTEKMDDGFVHINYKTDEKDADDTRQKMSLQRERKWSSSASLYRGTPSSTPPSCSNMIRSVSMDGASRTMHTTAHVRPTDLPSMLMQSDRGRAVSEPQQRDTTPPFDASPVIRFADDRVSLGMQSLIDEAEEAIDAEENNENADKSEDTRSFNGEGVEEITAAEVLDATANAAANPPRRRDMLAARAANFTARAAQKLQQNKRVQQFISNRTAQEKQADTLLVDARRDERSPSVPVVASPADLSGKPSYKEQIKKYIAESTTQADAAYKEFKAKREARKELTAQEAMTPSHSPDKEQQPRSVTPLQDAAPSTETSAADEERKKGGEVERKSRMTELIADPIFDEEYVFSLDSCHRYMNVHLCCRYDEQTESGVETRDVVVATNTVYMAEILDDCLTTQSLYHQQAYVLKPTGLNEPVTPKNFISLARQKNFDARLCYGDVTIGFQWFPDGYRSELAVQTKAAIPRNLSEPDELGSSTSADETGIKKTHKHRWAPVQLQAGQYCMVCQRKGWLKASTYQCSLCSLICHKKCQMQAHVSFVCDKTQYETAFAQIPSVSEQRSDPDTHSLDSQRAANFDRGLLSRFSTNLRRRRPADSESSKLTDTLQETLLTNDPDARYSAVRRFYHEYSSMAAAGGNILMEQGKQRGAELMGRLRSRMVHTSSSQPGGVWEDDGLYIDALFGENGVHFNPGSEEVDLDRPANEEPEVGTEADNFLDPGLSNSEDLLNSARELGRDILSHLPPEERKARINQQIDVLHGQIKELTELRKRIVLEQQALTKEGEPIPNEDKLRLEQLNNKIESHGVLMLHYCAGLQSCEDNEGEPVDEQTDRQTDGKNKNTEQTDGQTHQQADDSTPPTVLISPDGTTNNNNPTDSEV